MLNDNKTQLPTMFQLANILCASVPTFNSLKLCVDRKESQIYHFCQGFMVHHCIGGEGLLI